MHECRGFQQGRDPLLPGKTRDGEHHFGRAQTQRHSQRRRRVSRGRGRREAPNVDAGSRYQTRKAPPKHAVPPEEVHVIAVLKHGRRRRARRQAMQDPLYRAQSKGRRRARRVHPSQAIDGAHNGDARHAPDRQWNQEVRFGVERLHEVWILLGEQNTQFA